MIFSKSDINPMSILYEGRINKDIPEYVLLVYHTLAMSGIKIETVTELSTCLTLLEEVFNGRKDKR